MPCLSFGSGPPLVVFPGLGLTNANTVAVQRWGEARLLAPLARVFTVYRVGRRVGRRLAVRRRPALRMTRRPAEAGEPARRGRRSLSARPGREFQRRMAELARAGDRRGISSMMAPDVADSRLGRRIAGRLLWLAGPLFMRRDWDPSDMIATIRAEDAFDLGERFAEIHAPTLVVVGGRDRFYPSELFHETARRIPDARLVLYENRAHGGTFADRRFGRDVVAFLTEQPHT